MDLLEPVTQPYAWGSHTAIAELQGRPAPTAKPEAELWMGAHPSAPSGVERAGVRTTLDAVIAADPAGELGAECAARFGGRLPFLLKVLGVEKPLSIQVHPSREQAEAGYRAENERGLAPGDKSRNYVDDWPKPEILCALTRFEALAGMRTAADAAALLRALEVSELAPLAADLASATELAGAADPAALNRALAAILTWPAAGRDGARRGRRGRLRAGRGGRRRVRGRVRRDRRGPRGDHPGDLGIVASLLLRYVVLRPGEAIFMPAGGLHAYLRGTGVELLANSDNVVRAGLTPKHIDVPELLKLLDPAAARAGHRAAAARRRGVCLRLARTGVPALPGRARAGRGNPAGRPAAPGSCCAPRAPGRCAPARVRSGSPRANRATCPRGTER